MPRADQIPHYWKAKTDLRESSNKFNKSNRYHTTFCQGGIMENTEMIEVKFP